jgi:hypothetical protein
MQLTLPRSRSRYALRDYIASLDAEDDCQEIAYLTTCYEFPWDTTRSLEFALFRVFGVAKGTPLLVSTGEFIKRTQKRYDDTVLILSEILEHGYDSERGRMALRRMNQQHGRYPIPNDEYLYTLSTFIYEPIRWNARFGWRKLMPNEKLSSYYFWCEIGRRMNIKDIPASYEAFEQFNVAFERDNFRYSPDNNALAVATRDLMLGWVLPKALHPLGAPFVHALIDDQLLYAVGLPIPPTWMRRMVEGSLKLRGHVMRTLPGRKSPRLLTQMKNRTYPNGYASIEQLGADR